MRYTLNDIEKLTGIKAATVRVWERRYRLIKPHRTDTNRRWYDDDDLRRILNISVLYHHDTRISEIAAMSGPEIEQRAAMLLTESVSADTGTESLLLAMVSFDERAVNEVLYRSIINKGFPETFTGTVFPFLRRVGEMWLTGSIDIGAEHFVTGIFRRRLICAIDSLPQSVVQGARRVMMYLPEGEMHEMGLLYYHYLVRKMGHDVLYIGQNTPYDAVIDVAERWHPDAIITGGMTSLPFGKPEEYLKRLSVRLSGTKLLVSGALSTVAVKLNLPNLFAINSDQELKAHF